MAIMAPRIAGRLATVYLPHAPGERKANDVPGKGVKMAEKRATKDGEMLHRRGNRQNLRRGQNQKNEFLTNSCNISTQNVASPRPPPQLPAYLNQEEMEGLMSVVDTEVDTLLFQIQWRAGLRVSEALALEVVHLSMLGAYPTLLVAAGKGGRPRQVPVHPELKGDLTYYMRHIVRRGRLFAGLHRTTAYRRLKKAYAEASGRGLIASGRQVSNHTLRHSAARHWLASGIPINVVSNWLGHARLETTLIYLQILPDPNNLMDSVA